MGLGLGPGKRESLTRVQALGALAVAIACVAYGALVLWREAWLLSALRPPPLGPFLAFTIAALVLLATGHRLRKQEPEGEIHLGSSLPVDELPHSLLWKPRRIAVIVFAIAATGFVVSQLILLPPETNRAFLVPVWAPAMGLYAVAFLPQREPTKSHQASSKFQWEATLLVGILTLGFYFRVSDLGTVPFALGGDEAAQGLEAVRVVRGELRDPFTTGWRGVPTINFYLTGLFVKAMGPTVIALRLPWALVGTATILAAYALVRTLIDRPTALMTAGLLATYHYHIHFSRLGSNQIADPLLASLALLFVFRALSTRRHVDWALVGIVSGLSLYFYVGARLVPLLVVVVLVAETLRSGRPALRRHLPGLAVALGGFLVTAGPILQHAVRSPELYNVRIIERGILQSGWLVRAMDIRGETAWTILLDQFRRVVLAFNYYPDRTTWYHLRQPLLDPVFGAVFVMGLLSACIGGLTLKRESGLLDFAMWWLGATILGGMLVDSPPSSQQLVTLTVPVCFFVAWTLRRLSQLSQAVIPKLREGILLGCAAGLFAALSLRTYFHEYTPKRLYGGPYAELATAVAPKLEQLGPDYDVYLLGAPWMYADSPTLAYLAPCIKMTDLPAEVRVASLSALVPGGQGLAFAVIPQRMEDLPLLQATFPGVRAESLLRPMDRRPIATLYIVPSDG